MSVMTVQEMGRLGGLATIKKVGRAAVSARMKRYWARVRAGEIPGPVMKGVPHPRMRKQKVFAFDVGEKRL